MQANSNAVPLHLPFPSKGITRNFHVYFIANYEPGYEIE
jgi:hypothetical protein